MKQVKYGSYVQGVRLRQLRMKKKFHDNFQERMDSSGLIKAALRAG